MQDISSSNKWKERNKFGSFFATFFYRMTPIRNVSLSQRFRRFTCATHDEFE
jgi:hypothetical protein